MTTITTGILLRRSMGFKDTSIIFKTDSDWLLAIQPGFNDKEIVSQSQLTGTCFELGFSNKLKLRSFIEGVTNEAMLRIGEAWIKFHYIDNHLFLDYGRTMYDMDTEIDGKQFEDSDVPKLLARLKKFIGY